MNYPDKRLEIRARIREQPKVQGGQIHHRTCPHDKGDFSIWIIIIIYHIDIHYLSFIHHCTYPQDN